MFTCEEPVDAHEHYNVNSYTCEKERKKETGNGNQTQLPA